MKIGLTVAVLALALASNTTVGAAQTTAPAASPAMPAATSPAAGKKAEKPRTAKSLQCSAQADSQNIHGKPRKAFMSKCKAGKA